MDNRLGQKLGSLFGLVAFGFILFIGFYHFGQRFASEYSGHNMLRKKEHPDTFYNEVLPSDATQGRHVFHLD